MAENNGIRGINIEIGGNTSGLQDALKDVNKAVGVTARELREVESGLRFNPESTELLAQRQQLLARQIENTTTRLNTLRQAQEQVNRQFENGDISPEQFRAFNREIERTQGILDGLNNRRIEIEANSQEVDRLSNSLERVGTVAQGASNVASSSLRGVATAATAVGAAVGGALAAIGASQETAQDVAILNTQLDQVGLSLDDVSTSTARFASVGQQTDQISEAFGNLVQAGYTTAEQIDGISQSIAGAIVAYGDTFTSEGLAESITSTTQLGEVTGQLTDLLEKSGVDVENFNARLSSTADVSERANIISQALADEGLAKLYDAYATGNPEIVAQAQAAQELEQNWVQLTSSLTPLLTGLTEFANILLDVANGNTTVTEAFDILSEKADEVLPKLAEGGTEAISGFLEGMQEAAPQLSEFIQETLLELYDVFVENAPEFIDSGIDIVSNVLEGISEFLPQAAEKAIELLETIISSIIDNLPEVLDTGVKILENLLQGISNALPQLATAALNLIVQLAAVIIKNLPTILDAGVRILGALIEGIILTVGRLGNAIITQVIPEVFRSFLGEDWASIGRDIINGIAGGIRDFGKKAVEAIGGVVDSVINSAKKKLGIASPSKVFREIGAWTGEGMTLGIESELKNVEGAVRELADTVINTVDKQFEDLNKLEKEQASKLAQIETDAARKINDINLRAKESKKKLTAAQNRQIAKIEEDAAKKALETETKYGEKIAKKAAEVENTKLKAVQNYISQKKGLEQLSLVEETQLLQQSLDLFKEDSEARIKLQIDYQKALSKVFDETTKINEDYSNRISKVNEDLIKEEEKLTKVYGDELEKRTQALTDTGSLFDEFGKTVDVTGRQLLDNLQSQVDGLKDWEEQFTRLSERAIDDGLLEQLRQLGPEALGELEALNSLSDEELTKYSDLYAEKSKTAREIAIKELEPLADETRAQVQRLRESASSELDLLNIEWASKIRELAVVTKGETATFESIGRDIVNGIRVGISSQSSALSNEVKEIAANIEEVTRSTLKTRSPSRVMKAVGEDIADGLVVGLEARGGAVSAEASKLAQSIVNAFSKGETVPLGDLVDLGFEKAEIQVIELQNKINELDQVINDSGFDSSVFEERRKIIEQDSANLQAEIEKSRQKLLEFSDQSLDFSPERIESTLGVLYGDQLADIQEELRDLAEEESKASEKTQRALDERFDAQKELVRNLKKLGRLTLRQESQLYDDLANQYSLDSEQYAYFTSQKIAAQEEFSNAIQEVNNEYIGKISDANDELARSIESLENDYDSAHKGIRDTILGSLNVFKRFDKGASVSGQELLKNLQSQIRGINEYNSVINSLSERTDNAEFAEYIRSLGPDSLAELEALNSLSREELDQYVNLFGERFQRANESATIQLEDLRYNTDQEIAKLQGETASQLTVYQQEWANAISNITGNVQGQFSELPKTMEETGRDIISSISKGLSDTLPSLQSQLQSIANSISDSISSALDTTAFYADIQSSSQRLANATNSAYSSIGSSAAKSTAQQASVQNVYTQQANDNRDLIKAVNELAQRPIQTMVAIDGRAVANAVSTHQYQNASINALTKGVQIY